MKPKRNLPSLPLIMIGIGGLILAVAFGWILKDSFQAAAQPAPSVQASSTSEIARIPVKEAYASYTSKDAIFLDVRSTEQYTEAHIPGAINIPLNEISSRLSELSPDARIIAYCT